ncbi:hypothetical protein M1146_06765 [Patescibacteria group bacterium]|nr:hypothetical protein [Patescibacteria group bacterium]
MLNHAYNPFIGEFFIALATHVELGTIAMRLLVSVKFIENCLAIMENPEKAYIHPVLSDFLKELIDTLPWDAPLLVKLFYSFFSFPFLLFIFFFLIN